MPKADPSHTLNEIIDMALAEIYMDGANPVRVREKLKLALRPFLRRENREATRAPRARR